MRCTLICSFLKDLKPEQRKDLRCLVYVPDLQFLIGPEIITAIEFAPGIRLFPPLCSTIDSKQIVT